MSDKPNNEVKTYRITDMSLEDQARIASYTGYVKDADLYTTATQSRTSFSKSASARRRYDGQGNGWKRKGGDE
jgi:hypothetical protein